MSQGYILVTALITLLRNETKPKGLFGRSPGLMYRSAFTGRCSPFCSLVQHRSQLALEPMQGLRSELVFGVDVLTVHELTDEVQEVLMTQVCLGLVKDLADVPCSVLNPQLGVGPLTFAHAR